MEADRNADREVVAVAAEHLVRLDVHRDVEITRGSATQPGLALARQPNTLTVLDARWDPHVDGAGPGRHPGALTFLARVLDDRSAAPALGARFGEPERSLVAVDHSGPVAVRA